MATTYVLIASQVLGSSANTVTFSSIPSTYKDLVIRISARDTVTGTAYAESYGKPNNQTASASVRNLRTITGNTVTSNSDSPTSVFYSTSSSATASTFSNAEIYVPNYTVSQYKQSSLFSVTENNALQMAIAVGASLWQNTTSISSYVIKAQGSFDVGSSFYLYGI